MGVTASGIAFPDDSDPIANLQDHLQALAESVEAAIAPAAESAASLGITAGANWTIAGFVATRIGVLRVIQGQVTYSGSTLTGSASGDLSPDQIVIDGLPVDWRPSMAAVFPFTREGATFGTGHINAGGPEIRLSSLHATGTIASGRTVSFTATYVVSA